MSESVFKLYYYNKRFLILFIGISCVGLAVLVFSLITGKPPAGGSGLIFAIALYFLFRKHVVLAMFDEHFEYKITPLNSAKLVKYCDIENLYLEPKRINLRLDVGNGVLFIPTNLLNATERRDAFNKLKKKWEEKQVSK